MLGILKSLFSLDLSLLECRWPNRTCVRQRRKIRKSSVTQTRSSTRLADRLGNFKFSFIFCWRCRFSWPENTVWAMFSVHWTWTTGNSYLEIDADDLLSTWKMWRCQIPECESSQPGDFYPPWLPNAVPHKDLMPLSCYRYDIIRDLTTDDQLVEFCDAQILFNQSAVVKCDNFIYRTDELSILNAVNL